MREVEEIAEKVRQEPFAIMSPRGNCLARSFRFKKLCREAGIDAEVVLCAGWVRVKFFGLWMNIPRVHAWGEVDGRRIEVAAPLDTVRPLGYLDVDIKPVAAVWL